MKKEDLESTLDLEIDPKKKKEAKLIISQLEPNLEQARYLINEKFIRSDEKWVNFSKFGLIKFLEDLKKDKEWKLLYDKNGVTIHQTNGTQFTTKILLGKTKIILKKSLFNTSISLRQLRNYLYEVEFRIQWDINIKEYRILEEEENYAIFLMHYKSPIFFISERELVDKKIEFEHENKLYFIATSVEDYLPEKPNVIRCKNYLNSVILYEDEDNFYYEGLNQLDAKTSLPETLLNVTLPFKTEEYFRNLVKFVNNQLQKEYKALS